MSLIRRAGDAHREFEYSVEEVVRMRKVHRWRRGAILIVCAVAALVALLPLVLSLLDSLDKAQ